MIKICLPSIIPPPPPQFTHSQDVYFAITKRFSIVQLCAVLSQTVTSSSIETTNAHAHSVAAICAVCRRAREFRKPWITSTCISLKHYVRPPLLAR